MISQPLLLGEEQQLFGVVTQPSDVNAKVGIVILNAGLLHNVGPFRLSVDLANRLAALGFASIRIDQSGKGESPKRSGETREQSVLLDYDDASNYLQNIGINKFVILGLCSGADDALRIAASRDNVAGIVALDGYARQSSSSKIKGLMRRSFSVRTWALRIQTVLGSVGRLDDDLRDWDSDGEMTSQIASLLDSGLNLLAIFTSGQDYYDQSGQLGASLPSTASAENLQEFYNSNADHTYSVVAERQNLIAQIADWTAQKYGEDS